MKMNDICWPAIKEIVKRNRFVLLIFLTVLVAVAGLYGYKKSKTAGIISQTDLEKKEAYDEQIASYDAAIEAAQSALDEQKKVVEEQQAYIESSAIMRLDPQNIYQVTKEYRFAFSEGCDSGNIVNSCIAYFKDGGLIADAQKKRDDIMIGTWNEVISYSFNGSDFTVGIMQETEDKAQAAMALIHECLMEHIPTIMEAFGAFSIEEVNSCCLVKSDVNVLNTQNGLRGTLKSHQSDLSYYETLVASRKNDKEYFINSHEQPVLSSASPLKAFVKGFVVAMIAGIAFLCAVIWIILRFDGIVRGIADVERYGCSVFGTFSKKKGFDPEAARIAMDVELVSRAKGRDSLFIADLGDEKESAGPMEQLSKALKDKDFLVEAGHDPAMKADHLEQMVKAGQCVLFVRCGLTKNVKIQEFNEVCKKYGIDVIGTITMM